MRGRVISVLAVASAVVAVAAPAAGAAVAPGAPGTTSYFDLARKDCVGTARNDASKVWFTVADGVLSDTYWPNVDATNVKTLQYIVTDGRSFSDLQTRDMTYESLPTRPAWPAPWSLPTALITTGSSRPTWRILLATPW